MSIRALFLVACILATSGLDAAAVDRINPHDVLNQTRRDLNAFDKRMERDKAEQQKQEKEAEAKRKQEEAERPNREQVEQALQEAQRKREAAAAEAAKGASLSSPTTTPARPATGRAGLEFEEDPTVTASVHPAGPHHLPAFFTAPGETDVLMIG